VKIGAVDSEIGLLKVRPLKHEIKKNISKKCSPPGKHARRARLTAHTYDCDSVNGHTCTQKLINVHTLMDCNRKT